MLILLFTFLPTYLVFHVIERLILTKQRALLPKSGASNPYLADLPRMEPPYGELVEILNTVTSKKKLLACQSEQRALNFVKLFNLVSAFSYFDEITGEQQTQQEVEKEPRRPALSVACKED